MANEPAFDAFSQNRDTGVKQRTKETKQVYLDPNRFRLPPNRTMRVFADQLNMTVAPEKAAAQSLAESLAEVVPTINEGLAVEQVEMNKAKIAEGERVALAKTAREEGNKQFFEDEWHKYGYDKTNAFLQGEDLGRLLELDSLNRPVDVPYQEWYQAWYADKDKRGMTMVHPEFLEEYNKSFQQSLQTARAKDDQRIYEMEQQELKNISQEAVRRNLSKAYNDPEMVIDNDWWQVIKADIQMTSAWDNPQMDEFKFNTVYDLAKRTGDPELLYILMEPQGADGKVPALVDNPKYTDAITSLHKTLVKQDAAERKQKASEVAAQVTKAKTLNNENKRFINKELGSPDSPFASILGDTNDAYKNQDYATYYDNQYIEEFNRNGGDYIAAAEHAKQMTLAEAARLNDLDPALVKARRERAEFNLNADTKLMSLVQTKDGVNNPQGMALILEAYKTGSYENIPFYDELGEPHKKFLTSIGRKLKIQEDNRNRERTKKAKFTNETATEIYNNAVIDDEFAPQDVDNK